MFTAIIALIGSIVGIVGGAINAGAAKFAAKSAEYEANIKFERDKELSLYGIYQSQQATRNVAIVAGVIFVVGIAFVLIYNKKK